MRFGRLEKKGHGLVGVKTGFMRSLRNHPIDGSKIDLSVVRVNI